MTPKVSVVIPVFKAERFLDECVESILTQDYENLEVILVDDGSPDKSPEMCDEYAAKYNNVRAIHQVNSGPRISRNNGFASSDGEFVVFADSDDKLDGPHAVSCMVEATLKNNADVVVACYRRFSDDFLNEVNTHHLSNDEDVLSTDFRFKGFFQYGHLSYEWGKLYRRAFIDKYRLKRGSYPFTQDKAFNMRVYACKPRYVFIEDSVYCYRINENSVTYKHKENYIPVWSHIGSDFSRFLKRRNISENMGDLAAFHIYFGSFFLAKQELTAGKGIIETTRKIKKYAHVPYVRKVMKEIIFRRYTKGIATKSWRMMIWASTLLFDLHFYFLFVLGIDMLRKLNVDGKITKRRYDN